MGWLYKEVFKFSQNDLTLESFGKESNRKAQLSPLNAKPGTSTGMTLDMPTKVTGKSGGGKSGGGKTAAPAGKSGKLDEATKKMIKNKETCASLSLIWINATLWNKDRYRALHDSIVDYDGTGSILIKLINLFANRKTDRTAHAKKHANAAGVERKYVKTIKRKDNEGIREQLLYYLRDEIGWSDGIWSLTRDRTDGRHRICMQINKGVLFLFNPSRGEWSFSEDKSSEQTRNHAFNLMSKDVGLASKPGKIVSELEIWTCTKH